VRDFGNKIGKLAVIGDGAPMIGMRPIQPPNAAIAKFSDELARERHRVGVRRSLPADAVGTTHFDADISVPQQVKQGAKCRLVEPQRSIDAAHVIYHDRNGCTVDRGRELGDQFGSHVNLQMPAEIGKPGETIRRVRLQSGFGNMLVFATDGKLPYPFGRETTGYQVADLDATLAKAQSVGVKVLSPANRTVEGRTAMVEFPGGYVAEIHEVKK